MFFSLYYADFLLLRVGETFSKQSLHEKKDSVYVVGKGVVCRKRKPTQYRHHGRMYMYLSAGVRDTVEVDNERKKMYLR